MIPLGRSAEHIWTSHCHYLPTHPVFSVQSFLHKQKRSKFVFTFWTEGRNPQTLVYRCLDKETNMPSLIPFFPFLQTIMPKSSLTILIISIPFIARYKQMEE